MASTLNALNEAWLQEAHAKALRTAQCRSSRNLLPWQVPAGGELVRHLNADVRFYLRRLKPATAIDLSNKNIQAEYERLADQLTMCW
jgi:hypothetical protein